MGIWLYIMTNYTPYIVLHFCLFLYTVTCLPHYALHSEIEIDIDWCSMVAEIIDITIKENFILIHFVDDHYVLPLVKILSLQAQSAFM